MLIPDQDKYLTQMKDAAALWLEMPPEQWEAFASVFRLETLARQEHVLLPGSMRHVFFFIAEGLVRVYTPADDGKEANKGFFAEGVFAGPLAAFRLGLPSLYGVEALEPSTLLVARYGDLDALYEGHPAFERFGRLFMEWLVVQKELRERMALHQTSSERYQAFVEQYPDLARRVPQYHIASYLGITPESLSRVRSAMAGEP